MCLLRPSIVLTGVLQWPLTLIDGRSLLAAMAFDATLTLYVYSSHTLTPMNPPARRVHLAKLRSA